MKAVKQILSAVAVAAVALTAAQSASARDLADIYTQCGLGAVIAPKHPPVAAITNITWDFGTTAIISDVSSADTCKGGSAKTAAYIFQSYAQLEQDLARGEGEHLATLMTVAGCQAAAQPSLTAALRDDLADRVAQPAYATASRLEQTTAVYNKLQAAGTCGL